MPEYGTLGEDIETGQHLLHPGADQPDGAGAYPFTRFTASARSTRKSESPHKRLIFLGFIDNRTLLPSYRLVTLGGL